MHLFFFFSPIYFPLCTKHVYLLTGVVWNTFSSYVVVILLQCLNIKFPLFYSLAVYIWHTFVKFFSTIVMVLFVHYIFEPNIQLIRSCF